MNETAINVTYDEDSYKFMPPGEAGRWGLFIWTVVIFITVFFGNTLFLISTIKDSTLLPLSGYKTVIAWNLAIANTGVAIYIGSTIQIIARKKYIYSTNFCIFSKLWLKTFVYGQLFSMIAFTIESLKFIRDPQRGQSASAAVMKWKRGVITAVIIWCTALACVMVGLRGDKKTIFHTTVYQCSLEFVHSNGSAETFNIRGFGEIRRENSFRVPVEWFVMAAELVLIISILLKFRGRRRVIFPRTSQFIALVHSCTQFLLRTSCIICISYLPLTLFHLYMSFGEFVHHDYQINSGRFAMIYRISKNLPYVSCAAFPVVLVHPRYTLKIYKRELLQNKFLCCFYMKWLNDRIQQWRSDITYKRRYRAYYRMNYPQNIGIEEQHQENYIEEKTEENLENNTTLKKFAEEEVAPCASLRETKKEKVTTKSEEETNSDPNSEPEPREKAYTKAQAKTEAEIQLAIEADAEIDEGEEREVQAAAEAEAEDEVEINVVVDVKEVIKCFKAESEAEANPVEEANLQTELESGEIEAITEADTEIEEGGQREEHADANAEAEKDVEINVVVDITEVIECFKAESEAEANPVEEANLQTESGEIEAITEADTEIDEGGEREEQVDANAEAEKDVEINVVVDITEVIEWFKAESETEANAVEEAMTEVKEGAKAIAGVDTVAKIRTGVDAITGVFRETDKAPAEADSGSF